MSGALGTIGTVATGVAPGLLALGAAVLMVGVGMGIAAAGVGMMAEGFGFLVEKFNILPADKIWALAAAFAGFGFALYGLSLAMGAFAAPWTLLGIASFVAMAYAISSVLEGMESAKEGLKSLDKIITVTTKMKGADVKNMKEVIDQVVRVTGDASGERSNLLARAATALESLVGTAAAGAGDNQRGTRLIELKLHHKTFASGVADIMNEALIPTAFK